MRMRGSLYLLTGLVILFQPISGTAATSGSIWEYRVPPRFTDGAVAVPDPARRQLVLEVTPPDGPAQNVPAFFYTPYGRVRTGAGREQLTPRGKSDWRVRYTPTRSGSHKLRLRSYRNGEWQTLKHWALPVKPAAHPPAGFVQVHPKRPRHLQLSSGKSLFLIGHNVCWVDRKQGTYEFDSYLQKMADAGENYVRIWLCTWGLNLDTGRPWEVNGEDAWRLDHVLSTCQRLGIYAKLCVDNFYDLRNNFEKSSYHKRNGGWCEYTADVFRLPEAQTWTKARLHYLIGRYSAYPSLLAWELWNEVNYAVDIYDMGLPSSIQTSEDIAATLLIPSARKMAAYIKANDPHKHLVTTSLGQKVHWPTLWDASEMDIAQYHMYIHNFAFLRPLVEEDAAALVLACQRIIGTHEKPAFLAEFGYMGQGSTSDMNPQDPTGIALHNAIWAGAFSGAIGVPALWWWDNYIDPNNLYHHYKGLSTFIRALEDISALQPMHSEDHRVRVLALRGKRESAFWIQNRESTWHRQIKQKLVPALCKGVVLHLGGWREGTYELTWWDPYKGAILATKTIRTAGTTLRLVVPPLQKDLAARLKLIKK